MLSWHRSVLQILIPLLTLFLYLNFSTGALLFSCCSYFHLYWCIAFIFIFILFLFFWLLFHVYSLYDIIINSHSLCGPLCSLLLPRCMECRRGLAMRILSVCPSACLSVCPSVTRVDCDKTVEWSVQIFIPYERTFSLVFWEEKWLVGGDPFYVKFWVNRPPLEQNRRFWTDNRL